jgi:surface antigen
MKKACVKLTVLFTAISLLTACSTPPNKQDIGTVTGGVLGGLVGSRFGGGDGRLVAVGAGALLGAYMGGAIGKNMDDMDRMKMNSVLENNAVGQPAYWQNPKTGASYNVEPVKNVIYEGNKYCREYRSIANVAGKKQQVYGTACRQPDGSWQVVNSQ